jgi:hypothetical protein
MKYPKWFVSPEKIVKTIKTYKYVKIINIHGENRPCSVCSKIGTSIEILLNEEDIGNEINPNAMIHLGSTCWKKVKKLL